MKRLRQTNKLSPGDVVMRTVDVCDSFPLAPYALT